MGIASHTVVDGYGNSSHCNNCNKSNTNTQTQSLVIMCYTTKHGPSIKCRNRKRTRFVLKIENFPERQKSVKSNVIKVEVGDEEASQWILELVPRKTKIQLSLPLSGELTVSPKTWRSP